MVLDSIYIRNSHKPKFSFTKGATWDTIHIILPNNERIEAHIDTTWGRNVYFQHNGKWYNCSTDLIDDTWKIDLRSSRQGIHRGSDLNGNGKECLQKQI